MAGNYFDVFMPVLSLGINVTAQVIGFRYLFRSSLLHSVFWGFFTGAVVLFLLDLIHFQLKGIIDIFMVHIMTYGLLSYAYFHFINLGETARRIRILRELNDSIEGFSLDEILQRYNAEELINRRILRLTKNKQVIFKDGRYYAGKKEVLWMARILLFFKFILFGANCDE